MTAMDQNQPFQRYRDLQRFVGWTEADAQHVRACAPIVGPHMQEIVADFYNEIERHADARKVITGGKPQIERLKSTLIEWLKELLSGNYDSHYVTRRWRVGYRHVEIGLDQFYTNAALSRLRSRLLEVIRNHWEDGHDDMVTGIQSLNRLLDLDVAIIEQAYQSEYIARQQRAERLATIGQVAGGIAHELRNPLNVIKTSVYYLLNARHPSPDKTTEHLNRIEKQVGLADGVITALSSFAKLPLPNLYPMSVEDCVRETIAETPLPENIEVVIDCPASLPQVLADREQIQIVIGNLARNARDAMLEGGTLIVRAGKTGEHIEVSVSDNGEGIAADQFGRIMEPLYSTKARGIGLGLAMARAIVEKNNGKLSVESELNCGSTFTVRLHAAPEE